MASSCKNPQEAILAILREKGDSCVSGEDLSRRLGVSRAAVWKQIEALRHQGYRIEAAPARGYRLAEVPDLVTAAEIQAGLATRRIGRTVHYFEQTDSTNLQAMHLGEEGAAEGTVVIAESQSCGKGRLGRQWLSPPGVNLYTSVVLRPPIELHRAPQLTFVSAVAAVRAIRDLCGLQATVKWPNDILVDGRKVAGLLNEMSAESERIHFVVLGIGININMAQQQFPADLRYPATSLRLAAGRSWPRAPLARLLYTRLEDTYDQYLRQGFAAVARQWEEFCPWQGRAIEIDRGRDRISGIFSGIDENGALLLATSAGETVKIYSGDVRPCGS